MSIYTYEHINIFSKITAKVHSIVRVAPGLCTLQLLSRQRAVVVSVYARAIEGVGAPLLDVAHPCSRCGRPIGPCGPPWAPVYFSVWFALRSSYFIILHICDLYSIYPAQGFGEEYQGLVHPSRRFLRIIQ